MTQKLFDTSGNKPKMEAKAMLIRPLNLNLFFTATLFIVINQTYPMERQTVPSLSITTDEKTPILLTQEQERSPREGTLARAAYDGNLALVRNLIDHDHSINERDINGKTPLQEAICKGFEEIAGIIMDRKDIDLNMYSKQGLTALHYATEKQQLAIIKRLLFKGVPADQQKIQVGNVTGQTALHIAAKLGNPEIAALLLKYKANIDLRNNQGQTPLHYAAYFSTNGSGHKAVAELLINLDRTILDKEDADGAPALMMAILSKKTNNLEIIEYLIQEGASVNKSTYIYEHEIRNVTPLMLAVLNNDLELVNLLIKYKASINAKNDKKNNALDFAIGKRFDGIQRTLLAHDAKYTVSEPFVRSHNAYWVLYPLHEAADAGNLKRVQMIAGKLSGVNELDQQRCTPLHYACKNGHLAVVAYLVAKLGASIDEPDQAGKTPLRYATEEGRQEIVEYLIKHKASLTYGPQGAIYLNCAAARKDEQIAIALLNAGAQIESPLQWAVSHQLETVVQFLSAKKPLLEIQDSDRMTALHRAINIENDSYPLTTILIRAGASLGATDSRGKSPLDYSVDKRGLREFIASLTDVNQIVEQHRAESPEDIQDEDGVIDLQCPEIANLCMHGTIEHSLSQTRPNDKLNLYCGYYALFNALSCLDPARGYTRNNFVGFFRQALQTIQISGGNPPYDNLSTEQLRCLIRAHCQGLPIAVIELNSLHCYLKGLLATPKEAFEIKDGDEDLINLNNFLSGVIQEIAIVVGSGSQFGHWITIFAQRLPEDKVSIRIFDSYKSLAQWERSPLRKICMSGSLILYQMLTHSVETWKDAINSDLLIEIGKMEAGCSIETSYANQIDLVQAAADPIAIIKAFDDFIESLKALKKSIEQFSSMSDMQIPITDNCRILHCLRIQVFLMATTTLQRELRKNNQQRSFEDSLNHDILDLIAYLCDSNHQDLIKQLSLVASSSAENRIQLQQKLQKLAEKTIELKNKIASKPDSLTSGKFYDAPTLPISKDNLAFFKRYLNQEVEELIDRIKNGHEGAHVIFYGPPGNGKTTTAQLISQLCEYKDDNGKLLARPFRIMRVPALGNEYQFSKQDQLASLFTFISQNHHAVILLDEIDAISDSKQEQDPSAQVLQQIVDHAKNTDVILVGTTNSDVNATETNDEAERKNKRIAPALLSRTECKIKIDNPTLEHRLAIIENCRESMKKKNVAYCLNRQEEEVFAKKTDGFSIRDLESMFTLANQYTFSKDNVLVPGVKRQVKNSHFERAYEAIKKGKTITYWPLLSTCFKNLALHGPAWLSLAHGLYSTYIQELHHSEDRRTQEQWHHDDKIEARWWQVANLAVSLLGSAIRIK